MAGSNNKSDFHIQKLRGADNYHMWCFAMQNYFDMKKWHKCIKKSTVDDKIPEENNEDMLRESKSTLALSVEPELFVHILNCTSALEIWIKFKNLYEDRGLLRKITLLRTLISIRLESCDNMQNYLDEITSISCKLNSIGFKIDDDWLAAIMLAGLTNEFKPLILSFEASETINADQIKMKLLDTQYVSKSNESNAFFSKYNSKNLSKNKNRHTGSIICYECGGKNHKSFECNKNKEKQKTSPNSEKKIHQNSVKNNKSESAKKAFGVSLFSKSTSSDWFLDSGASSHMTPNANLLKNQKSTEVVEIVAANDMKMPVRFVGETVLLTQNETIQVEEVLHVPDLSANLLSVSKIVEKGNKIVFDSDGGKIYDKNGDLFAQCKSQDGVYKISTSTDKCMLSKSKENSASIWHRRFGHVNYKTLCDMRNVVDGMKFENDEIVKCEVCAMGKQSRLPFKLSGKRSENLLDLIHSDVCGPMETDSIGGAKYFLSFIDDCSRKLFVYFLSSKSQVFESFVDFKSYVENQTGRKIKKFRTDNGTEYCSKEFEGFFKQHGIQHQLTNVYTPQQNGLAERMNRTIVERSRCMIFDAELDKSFWAEAVAMAAYIINRTISSILVNKTPEEVWTGFKVDVSHMRIFGSTVMVHVPKEKRKKFDSKSRKMIFVGYDSDTKGFRCIDPNSKQLVISRDVVFHEKDCNMIMELSTDDNTSPAEVRDYKKVQDSSFETDVTLIDTDEIDNVEDQDYQPDGNVATPEIVLRKSTREPKPRDFKDYVSYFSLNNINDFDPQTVQQAAASDDSSKWECAMQEEIASLEENKTWSLVKLPSGKNAIKTKWVFKRKFDKDGEVKRYKARLVVKGCSQKYGVEYNETFSPVIRYASLRFLMALAVENGLKIHQMDAVTAFLQGNIDADVYIEQPECFKDGTDRACKLNRAMYGLKQAGRQWNIKLETALKEFSLMKSKLDPCIYFNEELNLIVACYVDDLMIFWKNEADLIKLKQFLCMQFKMKDLGSAEECVGIRIHQNENSIELDQSSYIKEILTRFGMENCKQIGTPSDLNQKLSIKMFSDGEEERLNNVPYQQAVGCLQYLTQCTRPDINFAINDVSRFNSNFGSAHWKAVKRILRYLQGTINYKLRYEKTDDYSINGYSDADWASDVDKRRSCTGYLFKLSNAAITWTSKRQPTVALSSTEAEYMAMSSAAQEAIWLKQLADELDPKLRKPVNIFCDNQSAICLAEMDAYRPRSKHIDIRHHHIREKVNDNIITIQYITTDEMVADTLTKAVTKDKHDFCVKAMGLC